MKRLLGLLAFLPVVAQAAPFLVASPYATNVAGEAVPTEFVVAISGITQRIIAPAISVGTNQVGLKFDLGPLNLSGPRTVTARARNYWAESAESTALTFTAGPPTAPTGLGLSAQ